MDFNEIGETKKTPKEESGNFGDKIKKHIGTLMITAISFVWLFYGFFSAYTKKANLFTTITSSLLDIVTAVMIASLLGLQGKIRALEDIGVITLQKEHASYVNEANTYAEFADEWADTENKAVYKKARTHLLSKVGLKYSDYFDDNGDYTGLFPETPKTKEKATVKWHNKRVKTLREAIYIKLTPISLSSISTDITLNYDENDMGKSTDEYIASRAKAKLAKKIVSTVILSQIGFEFVTGSDWRESLFNGAIKLTFFLIMGVIDYMSVLSYGTGTYPHFLRKKINALKRLIAFGKRKRGEINGDKQQ